MTQSTPESSPESNKEPQLDLASLLKLTLEQEFLLSRAKAEVLSMSRENLEALYISTLQMLLVKERIVEELIKEQVRLI